MLRQAHPVDIVVPCFNDSKSLTACLSSIFSQKTSVIYRVVVVNNNSTDKFYEVMKSFPKAQILNEERQGRSFARNKALFQSLADYICFIDADVVLDPDWLERMVLKIEQSPLYGGGESHVSVQSSDESDLFMLLRSGNKKGRELMLQMKSHDYPILNSAACIYRRQALLAVNGFDEHLNSYEDIDLSRRVALNGWVLFTEAKATAHSLNNHATIVGFGRRYFQLGENRYLFNLKWSDRGATEQIAREILYFVTELRGVFKDLSSQNFVRIRILKVYLLLMKNLGKINAYVSRQEIQREDMSSYESFVDQRGKPCIICHINQTIVLYYFLDKHFKYIKCHEDLDLIIMGGFLNGQKNKIHHLI